MRRGYLLPSIVEFKRGKKENPRDLFKSGVV
jgi:hypothetical protein